MQCKIQCSQTYLTALCASCVHVYGFHIVMVHLDCEVAPFEKVATLVGCSYRRGQDAFAPRIELGCRNG